MATVKVTDAEFEASVLGSSEPIVVDYWAEWCGPCKMIGPILEDLSEEMESVKIAKMNIDENPATPSKYGVRGIPTLMLFKDGELLATKVGVLQKSQLKQWIEESLED